jgi:hypothetical protein
MNSKKARIMYLFSLEKSLKRKTIELANSMAKFDNLQREIIEYNYEECIGSFLQRELDHDRKLSHEKALIKTIFDEICDLEKRIKRQENVLFRLLPYYMKNFHPIAKSEALE